jgi:hypothetical protein
MGTTFDARRSEQSSSRGLCPSDWLVPQAPDDEPASVLLESIRAERRDRSSSRANKRSYTRKGSTC